ncbi:MAG: hypothetical protein ACE5FL_06190 [Myxococcota bacterium]
MRRIASREAVWEIVGDLEGGVPRFEGGVSAIEITRRDGEDVELVARHALGIPARFRAVLRPEWCVMHARAADIGMAATATRDGRTNFAHFEGSRWLGRLGRPLFRRNVRNDFARLERLLRQRV